MNPTWRYNVDVLLFHSIVTLFKLLGIAPFSTNAIAALKRRNERTVLQVSSSTVGVVYNVALALGSLLLFFILSPPDYFYHTYASVDQLFVMATFMINTVSIVIIALIYVIQRKKIVLLINEILDVERSLEEMPTAELYHPQSAKFQTVVAFVLPFIIFIPHYTIVNNSLGLFFATLVIVVAFSHAVMIQYTIVLIYIQKMFSILNKSLELLVDSGDSAGTIRKNINFIRKYHLRVCEICSKVSDIFAWPSFIIVAGSSIGLAYTGNYFMSSDIATRLHETLLEHRTNSVLWIMHFLLPIAILSDRVSKLHVELIFTNINVQDVISEHFHKEEVTDELRQFAGQLMLKNVNFTALGLFSLDRSLLQTVFVMMISFSIILSQYGHMIPFLRHEHEE